MKLIEQKYSRLYQSITSTIYEGIVKIGYEKNTSISIYYDLGLVNYLLGTEFQTQEDCLNLLLKFAKEVNMTDERLIVTLVKKRFQFTVTSYGVEHILSEYKTKPFLKDLVEMARTHHFSLDDVKKVFAAYDKDFICEKSDQEEFQYVLSFSDKSIDEYIYCFNLNDCYYHRLLPYDFERL